MSFITDIIGGVATGGVSTMIQGVAGSVTEVVKRLVPDPDKQAELNHEVQIAVQGSITAQMQAMQSVMTADSQSDSKYTSGARPTVVYWSLGMISVIVGLGVFHMADPALEALQAVPDKLWEMITYGIGIFAAGRTVEKGVSTVTRAITRR